MNTDVLLGDLTKKAQAANYSEDDMIGEDGLRHCPKCGGAVQAYIKTPLGERLVPVTCPCRHAEHEKRDAERKLNQAVIRAETFRRDGIIHSGIYDHISLDEDNGSNPKISEMASRYIERWDEVRKAGTGILFSGSTGAGKTFFAAGIANRLKDMGIITGVASFPALVMAMSRDAGEILNEIGRYKLLVLDDFGASRNTPYGLETIYNIVERRESSGRPTIITTNLAIGAMKKETDLTLRRIYDRVLSMGSIQIALTGPSLRREKADERRNLARKIMYGRES